MRTKKQRIEMIQENLAETERRFGMATVFDVSQTEAHSEPISIKSSAVEVA